MRQLPIGQRVHAALIAGGMSAAAEVAREAGQLSLFERVTNVALEDPSPGFLHSALCAMSLPVRRPADEKAAILRQRSAPVQWRRAAATGPRSSIRNSP